MATNKKAEPETHNTPNTESVQNEQNNVEAPQVETVDAATEHTSNENADTVITEWQDKYIRLSAEFDNYRKRTIKEKEQVAVQATERILLAFLPVLDDLERSLTAAEKTDNLEALKKGIQLIHKNLRYALEKQGVSAMVAAGKAFDSNYHEAIAGVPVDDPKQKGIVIEEVEKGYMYQEKVLRYAKVITGE